MLALTLWVQLARVRQPNTIRPQQRHRHTFPGLNKFSGSIARFTVFMSSTVSSPSSSTRYPVFPIPTPCSPVPDTSEDSQYTNAENAFGREDIHVPSMAIARWMSLWTASLTDWSSRSSRKRMSPWKLPGYPAHSALMHGGLVWEGRTVSDMSDDRRCKPRLSEVLFRLVHELRELGYRNATRFHQQFVFHWRRKSKSLPHVRRPTLHPRMGRQS